MSKSSNLIELQLTQMQSKEAAAVLTSQQIWVSPPVSLDSSNLPSHTTISSSLSIIRIHLTKDTIIRVTIIVVAVTSSPIKEVTLNTKG